MDSFVEPRYHEGLAAPCVGRQLVAPGRKRVRSRVIRACCGVRGDAWSGPTSSQAKLWASPGVGEQPGQSSRHPARAEQAALMSAVN